MNQVCQSKNVGLFREISMIDEPPSGHYPIEHRKGEIERLHIQGAAMAPDCAIMLDRIGVGSGWTCRDLGCDRCDRSNRFGVE